MLTLCLILVLPAFLISVVLCVGVRRLSLRWGLVDGAGTEAHKLALLPGRTPVPNTGGVAVFAAIAWPMVGVLLGVWLVPAEVWGRLPGVGADALVAHLPGLKETTKLGGGLLVALAAMHVMGLIDDRRALGAWPKLGVQLAAATGLVLLCDVRILSVLGNPEATPGVLGATPGMVMSIVISVLWIAVITNAMNFLDNMDGLAAGVGLVAGGLYLAATLIGGQWFVAGLAALLVGALLGFLIFNLPPARLYLGDSGSLVVGLMLAVISVRTTYIAPGSGIPASEFGQSIVPGGGGAVAVSGGWYGALMPVLVLAVPLYDFTSVTVMRLLAGKSPFQGDHNHFSHRLLRKGLGKRKALAVILLATLATGLGGVILGSLQGWQAAIVAAQAAAVLGVLGLLESGKRG